MPTLTDKLPQPQVTNERLISDARAVIERLSSITVDNYLPPETAVLYSKCREWLAENAVHFVDRLEQQCRLACEAPKSEANAEYEKIAAQFRAHQLANDGKPEGTLESLAGCARMLDTYAPDLYPANELGQVDFARAMMESVADEIRAFCAAPKPDAVAGLTAECTNRARGRAPRGD